MFVDNLFIKLFQTPGCYYAYDVNKNSIIKISKEIYTYLCSIKKSDFEIEENREEFKYIKRLQGKGFFSSNRVSEIIHPIDNILADYLESKVEKITLQVTQQCNFRCKYCVYSDNYANRKHSNKKMSFDIAKKGIDFLIAHSRNCERINVGFYGGEPLLEFDLIKKCIEYTEEKAEGKEILFNITSNATLLNDEIVDFLEEHKVSLMISLDGPKDIHDKNRKFATLEHGTFDKLMENIEIIKNRYPEFFKTIIFNAVIDPDNDFSCINDFFMDYDLLKDSYINSTFITTLYSDKQSEMKNEEFFQQRGYEYFKVLLNKLNKLDKLYSSKILELEFDNLKKLHDHLKPFYKLPEKYHHSGPCVPGAQRLFIDVNGDFFPCERVSEASQNMKIGNINNGFDIVQIRKLLNIGQLSEYECKNCWAISHCTLCAAYADNLMELSCETKVSCCDDIRRNILVNFINYCIIMEYGYCFDDTSKIITLCEEDYNG